jgi:hypothetical protein
MHGVGIAVLFPGHHRDMEWRRDMNDPRVAQEHAKYVAMVVRTAMDDFYMKYLSDEQMKELNSVIRNAVFTALYARQTSSQSPRAKYFVDYHRAMIPRYWEEPELLEGYGVELLSS